MYIEQYPVTSVLFHKILQDFKQKLLIIHGLLHNIFPQIFKVYLLNQIKKLNILCCIQTIDVSPISTATN